MAPTLLDYTNTIINGLLAAAAFVAVYVAIRSTNRQIEISERVAKEQIAASNKAFQVQYTNETRG